MLNRSVSLAMSTSVLKALPGKLDIKRRPPSILLFIARKTSEVIKSEISFLYPRWPLSVGCWIFLSFYVEATLDTEKYTLS